MKSIFDGWTKKIEHRTDDGSGGYCATGWAYGRASSDYGDTSKALKRIGRWIIDNMNPPGIYIHKAYFYLTYPRHREIAAVVWANNECKLDIEGFRMVDLLSQGYLPETVEVPAEEIPVSA